MPPVFQFYLRQTLIGFAIAAAFVAALMWLNVGNLWHLITHSDVGALAVFLLWFFNGIVFSGVQTGVAVMLMAARDEDDDAGGGSARAAVTIRVPTR